MSHPRDYQEESGQFQCESLRKCRHQVFCPSWVKKDAPNPCCEICRNDIASVKPDPALTDQIVQKFIASQKAEFANVDPVEEAILEEEEKGDGVS